MAWKDTRCNRLVMSIHVFCADFGDRLLGWGIHHTISCLMTALTGRHASFDSHNLLWGWQESRLWRIVLNGLHMKTNLFNLFSVRVLGDTLCELLSHQRLKHIRGLLTSILLFFLEYQAILYIFLLRAAASVSLLPLFVHQIWRWKVHPFLYHFCRFDSSRSFLIFEHLRLLLFSDNTWHRSNPVLNQSFFKCNGLRWHINSIRWHVSLLLNFYILLPVCRLMLRRLMHKSLLQ